MKTKIIILLTAVFGCLGCGTEAGDPNIGTEEEQRYDALQLDAAWEKIVEEAAQNPVKSLSCHKVVRLAQFRLGQAGNEAIMECLSNPKESMTSVTGAMMMSDIYMQLGYTNLAQRAAFEAMVVTKSDKMVTRALQRLTETALITKQYDLARKYVAVLTERGVNSRWLKTMRQMAERPETIKDNPTFNRLQEQYEKTEDQFFM